LKVIKSSESKANNGPLKSRRVSVIHACESLAAGACRKRDLRDHLSAHQRQATQDSAVESPGRSIAGRGTNGCDRCDDTRARVSRNQLRHAGAAAGDDANFGLSLSRAFFRMGGGTRSKFRENSGTAVALPHAHFGNSLRPAGERHDLLDAHTTCGGRYPARQITGNPQNMIIGHFSRISFPEFSRALLPAAIVGLTINFFILRLGFRKMLREIAIDRAEHAAPKLNRGLFGLVCVVFVSIFAGFLAGFNLAWTAMAGAALVMVLARRDTHEVLKLVDWHLLVFFAALFIVVDGLSDTGLPDAIYWRLQPIFGSTAPAQAWNLAWFSVAGSNIFSNVPFVLVAANWIARFTEPDLMWKVLALATTFAGNLTIVGSVANMIVVESARDHIQIGFWDYARFGIPITVLTTAAGVMVLLVLR
jgi:predicted cation transporter